MAYTINTNIASLQAQDYLRITTDFQQKTINRVTSGLRIVNSGDDAAGLAIANGFRSDRAVLTQGVRNANDGLSTLQTIDGGINNISQLIDRARTLAAQSSSGTLPGGNSRTVLSEPSTTIASTCVSLQPATWPAMLPSTTEPCEAPKPVPEIVTGVPESPDAGLTPSTCGVFTVKGTGGVLHTPPCSTWTTPEADPCATWATICVLLQLCTTPYAVPSQT